MINIPAEWLPGLAKYAGDTPFFQTRVSTLPVVLDHTRYSINPAEKDDIMSIQGFSKPSQDMVIWAADDCHAPHSVRALLSHLGIQFTPCLGSYLGVTELSYLTSVNDYLQIHEKLCNGQESILLLGRKDSRNRHSVSQFFADAANPTIDLGRMYSVPVADAHKREGWTIPLIQTNTGEILAFVCDHMDKFGEPILQP